MNLEALYATSNISVIPAWLLLMVAPGWKWTDRIVHRIWIPGLLCIAWIVFLAIRPPLPEGAGIGTFKALMLLLESPHASLMIWDQLVAWDLFIGAWLARDARRHAIHHAWVVPCLFVTFLCGMPGPLLYFVVRYFLRGSTSLQEINAPQS